MRIPAELPIFTHAQEIVAAIESHPVVIVQGETGCGKTTQLPKLCLQAGRATTGMIALTQPRRIAARAVCRRIAEELAVESGGVVAYQVRFDDRTTSATRIKVVTDGILLAQIRTDRLLSRYDTVIIDEAHERSLNIDFLLGCLVRILRRRSDLRVVIASATIDSQRFSRHFGDAPVIEIPGRAHPVEVRYAPVGRDDSGEPDMIRAISDAVVERLKGQDGDGLVFLAGEREIRDAQTALQGRLGESVEAVPLYSRLSGPEQDRALSGSGRRRVVLATNIAETSLTVPRVRFVIDTGNARVLRYSTKSRIQRIPIERISRASAAQRAGRCGRIAPGVCIRLYSEQEFADFPQWPQPEIQRVSLASVILQMSSIGLGAVASFPFLDPPSPRAIEEGQATLVELGAFTSSSRLTREGAMMARLPVDPRLSRVLLESVRAHCLPEALVIASALSSIDPRERPAAKATEADIAHQQWRDTSSDAASILRLWFAWRKAREDLGSSALKRWCRERFVSEGRLREWEEIHRQLVRLVDGGWESARALVGTPAREGAPLEPLHRSIMTGFVSSVAQRTEEGDYLLATGHRFSLHPSSALARGAARWIVAAEIVDTGRRVGRTAVRIHPDWLGQVAPHLLTRSISEPHWVETSGQAAAWERTTLGALVVSPRRRVPLGPINPAAARQLFIQGALVEECVPGVIPPFMERNRRLRAGLEQEEARKRRTLIGDDLARYSFFDARIPEEIHSWPSFIRWLDSSKGSIPRTLEMQRMDLLRDPSDQSESAAEGLLMIAGRPRDVAYIHRPGDIRDGASIRVALEAASLLDERAISWGVPGSLAQFCEGMIRSLPRHIRQRLIPAREVAEGAAERLADREGSFATRLAEQLNSIAQTRVTAADFDLARVEPHLRILVEVVDSTGAIIDSDRDVRALVARIRDRSLRAFAALAASFGDRYERRAVEQWTNTSLPNEIAEQIPAPEDCPVAVVYPALVDARRGADGPLHLRCFSDELSATLAMRGGVVALLSRSIARAVIHHAHYHPKWEEICSLASVSGIPHTELLEDLPDAVAIDFVDRLEVLPRSQEAMEHTDASIGEGLWDRSGACLERVHQCLSALAVVRGVDRRTLAVGSASARSFVTTHAPRSVSSETVQRVLERAQKIFPPHALASLSATQLARAPRRLEALASRMRKVVTKGEGWEESLAAQFAPWEVRVALARERAVTRDGWARAVEFADLVEEFAVALWAQELGTIHPVSEQRLEPLARQLNVWEIQPSSGHA